MLRRLRVGLTVAGRALRPSSLYSTHSSTDSDSTDRDSIHSDPTLSSSHDAAEEDDSIYSPVDFGPAPYETPVASSLPATRVPQITVEYCNSYDIYEEYGFDNIYQPISYTTEVYNCTNTYVVPLLVNVRSTYIHKMDLPSSSFSSISYE